MARRRNRLWWMGAAVGAAAAAGAYLGLRWRVVPVTMVPCPECPPPYMQLYRGRSSWHGSHSSADLAAQRKARLSDSSTGLVVVHSPLGEQEAYYELYGSGGVRVDLSVIAPLLQPSGSIFDLPRLPRQSA